VPILPGRRLGPYEILSAIGAGGMGEVYKARDTRLDRTVAIKVLPTHLADRSELRERFEREAKTIASLNHPHICTLYDIGDQDGIDYLVMEYLEGETLAARLAKGPLPLDQVLLYAVEITEALDVAHRKGVTHRDLKPGNIMLIKSGCKLLDFGLAKLQQDAAPGTSVSQLTTVVDALTMHGMIVGTMQYMAPEQVEGKPVDGRTDLYALGLTLYEMVTGSAPFVGGTSLQVMYRQANEEPTDPRLVQPGLPDYFSRIILRCLEKDPDRRYQSARDLLSDLEIGRVSTSQSRAMISLPVLSLRGWLLASVLLALVILVIAIPRARQFILPRPVGRLEEQAGIPSLAQGKFIAVIPFRVLGDQVAFNYIADGLPEALTTKLFQLNGVTMASSTSAAKVDPKESIDKVARELGVNLVINGMIQGVGGNIRILVNLQRGADSRLLWTREFSGVAQDLLTLEDQIYNELVDALKLNPTSVELAQAGTHPTENIEAYDLYLRGRSALRGRQEVNLESALNFFEQALTKDSNFALAYAGLADASLNMYYYKKDGFWVQKALAAAQQAQRLGPNLAEVHSTLSAVYLTTGKTAEAAAEIRRALELAPNSDDEYRRLGGVYLTLARNGEAMQAYQRAIGINPYYWLNHNKIGSAYFQLGEYDKALTAFRRVIELEPDNSIGYLNAGATFFQRGEFEGCIQYFQRVIQIQPSNSDAYSNLGTAYFFLKRYNDSVKMFEKAVELSPSDMGYVGNLADGYLWSGQREKANATYDRAIALAYKELQVNPRSAETLGRLALDYANKGDSLRGVEMIRRARAIQPSDIDLTYAEAEVYSLAGRSAEALKSLRVALAKGYPIRTAKSDPELDRIQRVPEFAQLVSEFSSQSK
jgi:serine/threonine protein kinase/tetratricopeptide (TPR) repeat protein